MRLRLDAVWPGLAVAAGLAAMVTAGIGLSRPAPVSSFGSLSPPESVSSSAAPTSAAPTSAGRTPAPVRSPARIRLPARPGPGPALAGTPVSLGIPALGVRADIRPVTVADGVLAVPEAPSEVGWWSGSAAAGAPAGSVVLDGHVDSATAGIGALFRLAQLAAGDAVAVGTDSGSTVIYRVTARREIDKSGGLPADLFRTDGPPQLVLITCGGAFDRRTLSYRDNVVVLAVPTT